MTNSRRGMRCLLGFAFQTDAKAWLQCEPTPPLASSAATSPPWTAAALPEP